MSLRVLVVDDDLAFGRALVSFLRSTDHEADWVDGAEAALARLEEGSYDVLLTDVVMPGMTGLELVEQVRARRLAVRPILMSGSGRAADLDATIAWIEKPFEIDALLDAIEGQPALGLQAS